MTTFFTKYRKQYLILVAVILYFVLLTWISHLRAPVDNSEPNNYITQMSWSREGMLNEDGSVTVTEGDVLFGPYISLTQGNYLISFVTDSEQPFQLTVTCNAGERILSEPALTAKEAQFSLILEQGVEQVEFVLRGEGREITVFSVFIEPVESVSEKLNTHER